MTEKEKLIKRVLWISVFDACTVLFLSGIATLCFIFSSSAFGVMIGIVAISAALLELKGRSKLKNDCFPDALTCLVRSQVVLLLAISAYCVFRIVTVDQASINLLMDGVWAVIIDNGLEELYVSAGITKNSLSQQLYGMVKLVYSAGIVATVIFQGSMAWSYQRRLKKIIVLSSSS